MKTYQTLCYTLTPLNDLRGLSRPTQAKLHLHSSPPPPPPLPLGLRSLACTLPEGYEEVGLLLLFLGVGISLFATTIYALEQHLPGTTFSSVPMAWWWATTSMTTVGYGDIRPDSAPGKVGSSSRLWLLPVCC